MTSSVQALDDLKESLERFLSGPPSQRSALSSSLIETLRIAKAAGHHDEAANVLRRAVLPSLDYTTGNAFYRIRKQLRGQTSSRTHPVRLAVIGGFTTKQIAAFLDLYLFAMGVEAQIYESDYGVFRQEILDPASRLYDFAPQVVWFAVGRRDLGRQPSMADGEEAFVTAVQAEQGEWGTLWETLHERAGCQIIQNNFVIPAWQTFGNHEMRASSSSGRYISELNRALTKAAPAFVTIHDANHLSAAAGKWNWDDARFVHHAKMPCAPEYIADYAHSLASIVGVQQGVVKKCLVLDLDNTIWGGVIGDDGIGGVRLGQGNAEGEAFLAFQEYLKSLRLRGILLAVCSKNNDATAREMFEQHPEMILRLDDISCFMANWNDKASNIMTIARDLNIGLNSLVFIDDNPAERAIVRQMLSEVAVPEMPEDIAGYIQEIERHRYFQAVSVASEDFQRTEFYRADSKRKTAQTSTADMETFLRSLQMTARIEPVNPVNLERTAQLIQRSNQFNLTTRRYSLADVSRMMTDPAWITITVSLADRFGDNGLISVLFAKVQDDVLNIDTWLMSCRVLKRGVEHCVLNYLYSIAKERGLARIRGEYVPTPKNELVRHHYSALGFTNVAVDDTGRSVWELTLKDWQLLPHAIELPAAIAVNEVLQTK